MNRLIIIGNGFDLAHKMETGYLHFIKNYLKTSIETALSEGEYDDEYLMNITIRYSEYTIYDSGLGTVEKYIDYHLKNGKSSFKGSKIKIMGQYYDNPLIFSFKNKFFESLLDDCSIKGWVDIENNFYQHLKNIVDQKMSDGLIQVTALNNALERLTTKLELYLSGLDTPKPIESINTIFNEYLKDSDFRNKKFERFERPSQTMVLNFNYTSTASLYIPENASEYNIYLNHIHGKLNDPKHKMIFGYGDELDKHYSVIELLDENEYLKFIKSFWYFKTTHYRELIEFLDKDQYQVCTLGHSCGLSDRTMLSMIFDNKNCQSIKIYYHARPDGTNDFTKLTQNISRHFGNKAMMRTKVLPEPLCQPLVS